jgi:beta-phosphoglucomutase family hydrolase
VGKAFLFDMDGVIVDSNPLHREAWVKFNASHGLETTEAMQQRMYGKRNDEIVQDFFGGALSAEEAFAYGAAKEAIYREMVGPLLPGALVPGVREFLERHRDVPTGCATNAERANVDVVLQLGAIAEFFRVIVDGHQVSRPKPFPDIYLRAAELLGASPEDCLVFEDSYAGVASGLAAGMQVVALRTTHQDFQGVSLAVDDFHAPELEAFVTAFIQRP